MSTPEPARYSNIVRAICQRPWAVMEDTLAAICEVVALRVAGGSFSAEEIEARTADGPGTAEPYVIQAAAGDGRGGGGAVAVLPLYGVLIPRATLLSQMSGGTSLERFGAALDQAANDPSVGTILLSVDSPGGSVELVPETAAKVRAARSAKRVVAVANTMAASGAYWIASQAEELVVSPSGWVGSIGVITAHDDLSGALEKAGVKVSLITAGRYKAEANPYEPLDEEARAALQSLVDDFYGMFVADVAKGRGTTVKAVRGGYGQGRMLLAKPAVAEGMADVVATFDATLERLLRSPGKRAGARAEATTTIDAQTAADLFEVPVEALELEDDYAAARDEAAAREKELLARIRDMAVHTTTRLKEARA